MKAAPRSVLSSLVRAWAEPEGAREVLAPVVAVQELLSTRGYDEQLHRARLASKVDPFALALGLERLARDLLLGSKAGRPKVLAQLLVSFLPARAKRPREVVALLRAAERKDRGALPSLAAALGTEDFAGSLEKAAFADALATGTVAARLEVAKRIDGLARRELTMWFYPLLSRPD